MFYLKAISRILYTKIGIGTFIISVCVFLALNYYLNDLNTIGIFYVLHLPPAVHVPYIVFTFINTVLFGVSIVLIVERIRTLRKVGLVTGTGVSAFGSFIGLLAGACPGCIAGLFPAVVGVLGFGSVTLVRMPFYGAELQVVSAVLMVIGIFFLLKPMVCKV